MPCKSFGFWVALNAVLCGIDLNPSCCAVPVEMLALGSRYKEGV
ncbi:MAG TPA: hypothetical protein VKX49_03445 [Bryobacteraceae bacterium]|nr:hypothetical protein [Bryobacteraceae bacterium]